MEPETQKLISQWPDLSPEQAKLIFVRQSAQEAFEKGEIKEATEKILEEIKEISTVSNMSREDIGSHIGNLETARNILAAFTQGLMKGHASDVEPKIKAKRAKERKEKLAQKLASKDSKVNSLVQLAMNAASKTKEEDENSMEVVSKKVEKVKCEKCGKEVYSLKFHKC